jgi:hypothetical protein
LGSSSRPAGPEGKNKAEGRRQKAGGRRHKAQGTKPKKELSTDITAFTTAGAPTCARAASGCNIGAYFGGIASASLHRWIRLPAAFAGNILGTRLRPWFGLGVERTPSSC